MRRALENLLDSQLQDLRTAARVSASELTRQTYQDLLASQERLLGDEDVQNALRLEDCASSG